MKLNSRYEYDQKLDLLGIGGFARVYRARDELLHREVALKVFSASGKHGYTVLEEIRRVIQLEHPNLLRYYDVLLLEQANALGENEQLQIGVMEYANGGDLKGYARAHPGSPMLIKLLKQVLLGLEYLHGKGIIHRDLKAANILLVLDDKGEPTAKISDFGISKDMGAGQQSSSMMVGTIEYMAPEQFSPAKYGIDGKVGTNVDLWAFGVMVHELLLDSTPFGGRDGDTTVEQIMASILSTEQPKDIERLPEPYRSVVRRCLVANAKERIRKAAELIEYLEGSPSPTPQASTAEAETKVYPTSYPEESARMAAPQAETKVYPESGGAAKSPLQPTQDGTGPATVAGGRGKTAAFSAAVLAAVTVLAIGGWWYKQSREAEQEGQRAEHQADVDPEKQALARQRIEHQAKADVEKQALAGMFKPTDQDIKKFYDSNPALFRDRRIWDLLEIVIEDASSRDAELREKLRESKDVREFVSYLRTSGFKYEEKFATRGSEQVDLSLLPGLIQMKPGQAIVAPKASAMVVMIVKSSRHAPVELEQARSAIDAYLSNERKRTAYERMLNTPK